MTDDVAADVWYNIGQILVDIGDLVSAARSFRIALSHDPDHSESLVNLGILKHREGNISVDNLKNTAKRYNGLQVKSMKPVPCIVLRLQKIRTCLRETTTWVSSHSHKENTTNVEN